jgi:carbonic anhydrase/SulP family sulfate permease
MFLPNILNLIPLSCLAAILLVTGIKLASPKLAKEMWQQGRYQFIPFIVTVVSIVMTDLLIGILIGLAVSLAFILHSNMRRPLHRIVEKHLGGEVIHIILANQVSFLNRAALDKVFNEVPRGAHLLLDACNTVYIDPDILSLIREYKEIAAPVRGVRVSLRGFRERYKLEDEIQYVDYSTRELQGKLTWQQVLQILMEGNERFRTGQRLTRDLGRQLDATARGQHPLAVVHSCIDSRTPAELIFDLGLGDIFSIRVAGNVVSPKVLGSMEYGCAVAGAKLIFVVGHTKCGAIAASVDCACARTSPTQATGCNNLEPIVYEIQESVDMQTCKHFDRLSAEEKDEFVNDVARKNVLRTVNQILEHSETISRLVSEGKIAVVGAIYDVCTGSIDVISEKTRKVVAPLDTPQTANAE